ncbi:Gfo/Idh/MocA family protein [Sediminispirochaeta smaragdinae]|uniref:Oxidoreductase domain protein n=1 Tax=Sediminispirochaeta smaragdinae (strain DSM 11293 / JCM 15392 / SEBR 4228) TaxID=573413 RepID=E1RAZ9_SEDSS|nr:Gfo/Idh/MocA family oxidoreductase [Sediminispirochaeta smaragdinae]ADK79529.1 oxidoreductase domain protein [Sediminispirochaeta smaragdinae DSM 11293]
MTINPLRWGIIGAGTWGKTHADIVSHHLLADLVAIADLDPQRAERLASEHGVAAYGDYREMLEKEELDAVSIVTPDFAHAEPFIACCEAGKHVLLEKPLATNHKDLARMKEAHAKSGIRCMVDYHNRWNPPIALAYQDIQEGKIGDIVSMYYRLNDTIFVPTEMLKWSEQSSILWFLGSHSVDTLRFFCGSEVDTVYALSRSMVLKKRGIDIPDIYQTIMTFKNGVVATMENGWITPNTHPHWNDIKVNVTGTKGMFNMDLTNNQSIERYLEDASDHPDTVIKPILHGKPTGFSYESIIDFIEKIYYEKPFLVDFQDAYNVSKVILSIFESVKEHKIVTVEY